MNPIIYVSNASWHYGLPTNRQQLPRWLAKHTKVLYSSPFSLAQALLGRVPLRSYRPGLREIQPNLYLFDNLQLLPVVRGQRGLVKRLDQRLITDTLKRHQHRLRLEHPILWLYFPPSPSYLVGQLGEALTCYHCTDDHAGHAQMLGFDPLPVRTAEEHLVRTVDVVFTTSRPLYEEKVRHNPNTFLMPNVAEIDLFAPLVREDIPMASELQDLPRPIAGFVGAISAYKIDMGLVLQTAKRLPNWSFVFVGPIGLGDGTREVDLPKLPNVYFLGRRAYEDLPTYIAGFDVCTIPYQLNSYTAGVFPLKFWEYLASGKPVVSTSLPSLLEHAGQVWFADDAGSFADALQAAIMETQPTEKAKVRLKYAKGQNWNQRAQEMLDILRLQLEKKGCYEPCQT